MLFVYWDEVCFLKLSEDTAPSLLIICALCVWWRTGNGNGLFIYFFTIFVDDILSTGCEIKLRRSIFLLNSRFGEWKLSSFSMNGLNFGPTQQPVERSANSLSAVGPQRIRNSDVDVGHWHADDPFVWHWLDVICENWPLRGLSACADVGQIHWSWPLIG